MKDVILRLHSRFQSENLPPSCGTTVPLTEEEEDSVLDSVLGPPPEEEDGDETVLTTGAVWEEEGDHVAIRYEESELSGMAGATSSILFSKKEPTLVTISRSGSFRSSLTMEQGRIHTSLYETPVMPMEVTTHTHYLKNELLEGGALVIDYTIRIGTITASRTRVTIEVRDA